MKIKKTVKPIAKRAAARGAVAVLGAEAIDIVSAVSGVASDGRCSALAVVETGSGVLAAPANHTVIVEGSGHYCSQTDNFII